MFRTLLLAVVVLAAPTGSLAAEPADIAESFLRQVSAGEVDKAMDAIFAGSGMAEAKPQAVVMMKTQTKAAMSVYGTFVGLEKVSVQNLSPSLTPVVYLQKFEQYPVAWEFYFYRAKDKWALYEIYFKDQVSQVLGR